MEKWRATLAAGDPAGAWDLFIARYRPLIVAVIGRTVDDDDDISDVFAEVCADLSRNDLERISRHKDSGKARFSTWLVTVVHHRTIDWIRHRDGRRRIVEPTGLSDFQTQIFHCLARDRRSHVEAYEIIRQKSGTDFTFAAFMREVTATYRLIQETTGAPVTRYFPGPPTAIEQPQPGPHEMLVSSEDSTRLIAAMACLDPAERLAVQLFVVDELPAAAVATAVGWPNSKAVYNRVYRALVVLRAELKGRDPEQN